jgi:hypothetical protein
MEVSYEDIKRDYEPKSRGFCGHKKVGACFPLEYFWVEDTHTIVCDWCLSEDGLEPYVDVEAYSFEEEQTRFFIGGTRLHGQTWYGNNPVPGYTMHPEPPHPFDGGPN